jgi:hypothetical protein
MQEGVSGDLFEKYLHLTPGVRESSVVVRSTIRKQRTINYSHSCMLLSIANFCDRQHRLDAVTGGIAAKGD